MSVNGVSANRCAYGSGQRGSFSGSGSFADNAADWLGARSAQMHPAVWPDQFDAIAGIQLGAFGQRVRTEHWNGRFYSSTIESDFLFMHMIAGNIVDDRSQ